MKAVAQRIAIAEACGWTPKKVSYGTCWTRSTPPLCYAKEVGSLPDYLNDLNAMHEAEKVLTKEAQCGEFSMHLAGIVHGFPHDPHLGPQSYTWHATAAQRAEAFLRTLSLWKDEP